MSSRAIMLVILILLGAVFLFGIRFFQSKRISTRMILYGKNFGGDKVKAGNRFIFDDFILVVTENAPISTEALVRFNRYVRSNKDVMVGGSSMISWEEEKDKNEEAKLLNKIAKFDVLKKDNSLIQKIVLPALWIEHGAEFSVAGVNYKIVNIPYALGVEWKVEVNKK